MVLRNRRWRLAAIVVGGVLAALLLILAAFPWGIARGLVERRLSARFGRPVTIASLDRLDGFGLSPILAIHGLSIPQPAWAGGGDFVRLAEGRATLPLLPLLIGRVEPRDMVLRGLRLALVRRADGTVNWRRPGAGGGGLVGTIAGVTIADATLVYRDAMRDRRLAARLDADARGVRLDGSGSVMGNPVTLAVRGPAVTGAGGAWPFTARIDGGALAMSARGTMDRPLDTDAMTLDVTARADDLRLVDAIIEAGLFGTQKVALAAHVRHDSPTWRVTGLTGTIGRATRIEGDVTSTVEGDDRHRVTGRLIAPTLDPDDLASTAGQAEAAALRRRDGARLVPDLPINLAKLGHTDGRIDFRVDRLVSTAPSALAAMRGTVTLDHQVLVADPFTLDLTQGRITGTGRVAQGGRAVPTVTLDLRLAGSSIPALAGGHGRVTGSAVAHARLTGPGATIREAVGNSDGRIGLVARDGILPARLAAELGFNAGGAFFAKDDDQAALRCVVVPLTVRHGHGTLDPAMIVDTSQSQLTGSGSIDFPSEAMAITVTGAPKHGALLRLPGSATIGGTIRDPRVTVAPGTRSVGNFLKAIGRAITGDQGPVATDADCDALAAAALR